MNRKKAISIIIKKIKKNIIISANGYNSRDLYATGDKDTNFYMIGSMGLASSIGLGIAIKNPKKRIFVFDGDGNILMNLGSMTTIGTIKPKNLVHVVFDNNSHESTGGQSTNSEIINLEKIAQSVNYKTFVAGNKKRLELILNKIKSETGPIFLKVKISKTSKIGSRINIDPIIIKDRFQKSLIQ